MSISTICKDKDCARKDYGLLLLRIALGVVFIVHGYAKLSNLVATQQFFVAIGLPAMLALVVGVVELVGGLMVLVGAKIRWAAIALAAVMVGAIVTMKFAMGFVGGWEFDFVLLLLAIALAMLGSGHVSVSGMRAARRAEAMGAPQI